MCQNEQLQERLLPGTCGTQRLWGAAGGGLGAAAALMPCRQGVLSRPSRPRAGQALSPLTEPRTLNPAAMSGALALQCHLTRSPCTTSFQAVARHSQFHFPGAELLASLKCKRK